VIAVYIAITIILVAFLISQSMNKIQKVSSKSICVICDDVFDESTVIEEDSLSFCKEHYQLYKNSIWFIAESCECSPGNEEASVVLFNKKISNFKQGTLGFLRSSYKESNGQIITTLDYYQKKSPTE
jgi:hypothetical protein